MKFQWNSFEISWKWLNSWFFSLSRKFSSDFCLILKRSLKIQKNMFSPPIFYFWGCARVVKILYTDVRVWNPSKNVQNLGNIENWGIFTGYRTLLEEFTKNLKKDSKNTCFCEFCKIRNRFGSSFSVIGWSLSSFYG